MVHIGRIFAVIYPFQAVRYELHTNIYLAFIYFVHVFTATGLSLDVGPSIFSILYTMHTIEMCSQFLRCEIYRRGNNNMDRQLNITTPARVHIDGQRVDDAAA